MFFDCCSNRSRRVPGSVGRPAIHCGVMWVRSACAGGPAGGSWAFRSTPFSRYIRNTMPRGSNHESSRTAGSRSGGMATCLLATTGLAGSIPIGEVGELGRPAPTSMGGPAEIASFRTTVKSDCVKSDCTSGRKTPILRRPNKGASDNGRRANGDRDDWGPGKGGRRTEGARPGQAGAGAVSVVAVLGMHARRQRRLYVCAMLPISRACCLRACIAMRRAERRASEGSF
jgi:hypothetical protein